MDATWLLFFSGEQVRGNMQRLAPESHDGSSLRTNTGQIQRRRARARPWTPRPRFNISASLGGGSHPVMLREEDYLLKPHSRTARLLKVVRAPLHHPPDHAGGEAREKGRSGSGCG